MEKWRNFLSLLAVSGALVGFNPAQANADYYDSSSCNPCWDPCECGGFYFGADFLWWKPCVDDLDYAAERVSEDPDTYKYQTICLEWEPGVRVWVGKEGLFFGRDLTASYTYVYSHDDASVTNDENIVAAIGHAGVSLNTQSDEGEGSWDSCYHEWDVLISFGESCYDCYQVSHAFGVAGLYIDQDFKSTITDGSSVQVTKWDSDLWAVGFKYGAHFESRIVDCLSFFADGTVSVLVGEADSKISIDGTDSDEEPFLVFKDKDECQLIPGYHLMAGFKYDLCVCDWEIGIRLGYEFLAWHNFPNHRTFVGDTSTGADIALSTSPNTRTYGFHGLFVGAQMSF